MIISVVFSSIAVLLQRVLLHKDKADPIAYAILFEAMVGILLACVAIVRGVELPDFSKYFLIIAITVTAFGLGNIAYAKSLQLIDASVFSVLFATNTLWVMLGGVLIFNERLSLAQIAGTLLILLSVGLLADRTGKFKLDKGLSLGLLTGCLFGIGIVGWVYIAKRSDPITWNALSFLIPATLMFLALPRTAGKMKSFAKPNILGKMLVLSGLVSISSIFLLNAFNNYKASVVSPLIQTEVLLTVILAIIFLHERKNLLLKLVAAVVCLFGILLIVR